jgi:isoquinoline 1-oxidoreductase beta subunit
VKRLDTAEKTNGSQIYGMDVKLPGMLNAAIKDCPVFGGKVKSLDEAKIEAMPGVKKRRAARRRHAVAVVADTWWHAKTALDALPSSGTRASTPRSPANPSPRWLKEGLDAPQAAVSATERRRQGGHRRPPSKVEAVYSYPYQNHATMEVMNATALWTPERCEVWTPTQNGEAALPPPPRPPACRRRSARCTRSISAAASAGAAPCTTGCARWWIIAKQMPGTPVKLLWSREEDMLHGPVSPGHQCKLTGALDADNNLTGLHMRIAGQSIVAGSFRRTLQNGMRSGRVPGRRPAGEADIGYGMPNLLIDHAMRNPHVPPGFWRGVNLNQNAIYLECFMDELAHAAGKDPLEFRRKLMANHPKHLAVLNAVAEKRRLGHAGADVGGQSSAASRRRMGFGSYVAAAPRSR